MNKNGIQHPLRRVNNHVFADFITGKAATVIENDNWDWEPEPDERFEPYRKVISPSLAGLLSIEGERRSVENKLHIILPGITYIFDDARLADLANA